MYNKRGEALNELRNSYDTLEEAIKKADVFNEVS